MRYTIAANEEYDLVLNEKDPVASVIQNIRVILSTIRGTVPLFREFGLSSQHYGQPMQTVLPMLYADIKETIEKYEPRVRVNSIYLNEADANTGAVAPILEVIINEQTEL